jgi:hypothetical protein
MSCQIRAIIADSMWRSHVCSVRAHNAHFPFGIAFIAKDTGSTPITDVEGCRRQFFVPEQAKWPGFPDNALQERSRPNFRFG